MLKLGFDLNPMVICKKKSRPFIMLCFLRKQLGKKRCISPSISTLLYVLDIGFRNCSSSNRTIVFRVSEWTQS